MRIFRTLNLWVDSTERNGPDAMAVDEWLFMTTVQPILRVYRWQKGWISMGYFGNKSAALAAFPDLNLVRRCTGGGIVDHRNDWTYSLIVPPSEALARSRGSTSYQTIHQVLAKILRDEGIICGITSSDGEESSEVCFRGPVKHDLIQGGGVKLAGAGQKRSKFGLLHQGSVASPLVEIETFHQRSKSFASALADSANETIYFPPSERIDEISASRYGSAKWSELR